MPLSRYSIRNEYSLADPELYRAADKDDPEALLEGVAMAGLVGVLRQLGDLAEFAAEIFHDLHEDLMATAARGHGLTVRVQQIEAEFPSIEKAFLSHTSHSSFFFNTGVDWHPNVHMDQNLVTQGDLPRFVMDSYEECRGPPRLFLLDKFDVAGAGSCLKRYTDPSFFKTESPLFVMPSAEVQREKKGRKSKKKGSRWKNAETPEVLSTSHVKLQQLLLEERVENHVSDPARRVKLKRRQNGFPFDSTLGKSYMDAILKIPTPEPEIVREISITSSPLKDLTSVAGETENKALDITAISPGEDTKHRKRSTFSSSDSEAVYKPLNHSLTEEYSGISPNLTSTQIDHVHCTPNEVDKKERVAEGINKKDGYQSDDEVDNYVDALASMDSEMETDTEYRAKNDMHLLNVNGRRMGSDVTEELSDIQTYSTDGQSIVNSSQTDGGSSKSRRGKSSFTHSGSPDLAENTPSEEVSPAKTFQSTVQREPFSSSSITESNTVVLLADPGEHFMKRSLLRPELDVTSSNHSNLKAVNVNNVESSFPLFKNIPWTSNYDSRQSRADDGDSSKMSLNSLDGKNEQHTHESHASLHLPSVFQRDSGNNSSDVSTNDLMQGETLENEQILDSVASRAQSLPSFSTQTEEFANSEIETCRPLMEPDDNASEETASRSSSILDCSVTADLVDMQLRKPENGHLLDPGVGFSCYQEVKPDVASSSKGDGEELSESSLDNDLIQKDDDGTYFSSEIRSCRDSQHVVDVSPDDGIKGITYLQEEVVATAESETNLDDNGGDAASLETRSMTLQGKHSLVLPYIEQNDLKSDEQHIHKSSPKETVNEQANVFSELEPISSKTQACDDYSDFDLSHRVSDSFSGESSRNSSHLCEENAVECSYQNPEDAEGKSLQNVNISEKEEYAHSSPTRHFAVISTAQNLDIEFYKDQVDVESWHDLVSELKSTHHDVVSEDTENVLSSPKNHLAEVRIFDEKVESQNGTLDVKSCHVTHDQVPELEYSHQTCAIDVEEDISLSTHHATKLRIPLEENTEPQKDQFDLEFRYAQTSPSTSPEHIDSIENAEDSVSSPTHINAELRDSREREDDESLTNKVAVEPCQRQHSDSCEKAEASVAPFTYDTTELNPPMKHEVEFQNNQFEVKSWHPEVSELEHDHHIIATESSETVVSSDAKIIAELTTPIDQTCELQDQFNQKSRLPNNANVDPLSLFRQPESSISIIQERESYPSSEISAVHLPNQPPISQFLPQFNVSKPAEDPLISKVPTAGLLPEASFDEIPPVPPLPPMQWILGKAPDNFPATEENLSGHSMHSVPPLIAAIEDKSLLDPASGDGNTYPSNVSLETHNSQDMDADQADYVLHSSNPLSHPDPDLVTNATSGLEAQMDHSLKSENVLSDSCRGLLRHEVNPLSPPTTIGNTSSALPLSGKTVEPHDQPTLSTSSKLDKNIQGEAIVSEEKTLSLPTIASSLPVIHVYEKQPVLSTSDELATWTSSSSVSLASSEDGTPNENEKIKLPRPRNPLIDAVVAHDKSKLRKVTRLPQAQHGQKPEERDSLLEQIRAKSFNLKPAVVTRPSIQGPKTDLRLAAILEKANAIRQAFAGNGSDEDDDDDGWSDS